MSSAFSICDFPRPLAFQTLRRAVHEALFKYCSISLEFQTLLLFHHKLVPKAKESHDQIYHSNSPTSQYQFSVLIVFLIPGMK